MGYRHAFLEQAVELVLDIAGGLTPVAAAKRPHIAIGTSDAVGSRDGVGLRYAVGSRDGSWRRLSVFDARRRLAGDGKRADPGGQALQLVQNSAAPGTRAPS